MEKLRILVVEDDDKNVKAAREMLKEHELTIITGYDEAHNLLKTLIDKERLQKDLEENLPKGWMLVDIECKNRVYISIKNPIGETKYYRLLPGNVQEICKIAIQNSSYVPFDVVLTDVMLPKGGNQCMGPEGSELVRRQGAMPYGPIIALRAIQAGVKKVGILTSGNHHDDPFVFAFDQLNGFEIGELKVVCSNRMDVEIDEGIYVKDWVEMLEKLV